MGAPTTNARAAAARMIPERAEREIAFDVETDGHDDGLGRILSIGAVEILDHGKTLGRGLGPLMW
jgi:DNA polymerase III epsilon subunit-like protein